MGNKLSNSVINENLERFYTANPQLSNIVDSRYQKLDINNDDSVAFEALDPVLPMVLGAVDYDLTQQNLTPEGRMAHATVAKSYGEFGVKATKAYSQKEWRSAVMIWVEKLLADRAGYPVQQQPYPSRAVTQPIATNYQQYPQQEPMAMRTVNTQNNLKEIEEARIKQEEEVRKAWDNYYKSQEQAQRDAHEAWMRQHEQQRMAQMEQMNRAAPTPTPQPTYEPQQVLYQTQPVTYVHEAPARKKKGCCGGNKETPAERDAREEMERLAFVERQEKKQKKGCCGGKSKTPEQEAYEEETRLVEKKKKKGCCAGSSPEEKKRQANLKAEEQMANYQAQFEEEELKREEARRNPKKGCCGGGKKSEPKYIEAPVAVPVQQYPVQYQTTTYSPPPPTQFQTQQPQVDLSRQYQDQQMMVQQQRELEEFQLQQHKWEAERREFEESVLRMRNERNTAYETWLMEKQNQQRVLGTQSSLHPTTPVAVSPLVVEREGKKGCC
eukprot:GHVR01038245.1.p1 GENE.GHVR01038245.1~~GHVR01038245.1.p1  ORF type:complete len:496 (+),score=130.62 GHVR01038245.1:57-1544(+)